MRKKADRDTKPTVTTTPARDEKVTWRVETKDEAEVRTATPETAEPVPSPHETIAGKNQEDEAVAGAERGLAGLGPGPGPGQGPPLVTKGQIPTRRRPGAEEITVGTIPPVADETRAQTNGISYDNSLGE